MGRVLVRQVVSTVEAKAGTEAWVEDGPHVAGMVAGGYWEVVDTVASVAAPVSRPARKRPQAETVGEVVEGGVDPVEPAGDDGGAEPVRVS